MRTAAADPAYRIGTTDLRATEIGFAVTTKGVAALRDRRAATVLPDIEDTVLPDIDDEERLVESTTASDLPDLTAGDTDRLAELHEARP